MDWDALEKKEMRYRMKADEDEDDEDLELDEGEFGDWEDEEW
ncbi:hypothetical protein MJ1_0025 [Nanobdella aerobiophila]|uniref:Uncharacterized protein n=1 Tax=Nanobdella aerobiophila TaxID=2586965 RepID=A0A915WSD6_9ARCH|nr:hypothetical protein [Nanobdella aerobiophila]BBL45205.1 hypothetical protein MJ1_0025 [Nanobdella aerobiophila]